MTRAEEVIARLEARIEGQDREIEQLGMQLVACGVVALANTPESAAKAREMHPEYMSASCGDVIRAVDSQMLLRAELALLQPGIERAAKFVEVVRECEQLASGYCGTIDGVEEHGGDDHEDPTCAIWHRLYYAMFDGDRAVTELSRIAVVPATQQRESGDE